MDKGEIILCDSNVMIDWINHRQKALNDLQLLNGRIGISVITEYEIIAGAIDLNMQKQLEKFLKNCIIVHIDDKISELGIHLYKKYKLSHGLDMPDSLIAATAIELKLPLFTYNTKDFRFISGIYLYQVM